MPMLVSMQITDKSYTILQQKLSEFYADCDIRHLFTMRYTMTYSSDEGIHGFVFANIIDNEQDKIIFDMLSILILTKQIPESEYKVNMFPYGNVSDLEESLATRHLTVQACVHGQLVDETYSFEPYFKLQAASKLKKFELSMPKNEFPNFITQVMNMDDVTIRKHLFSRKFDMATRLNSEREDIIVLTWHGISNSEKLKEAKEFIERNFKYITTREYKY